MQLVFCEFAILQAMLGEKRAPGFGCVYSWSNGKNNGIRALGLEFAVCGKNNGIRALGLEFAVRGGELKWRFGIVSRRTRRLQEREAIGQQSKRIAASGAQRN